MLHLPHRRGLRAGGVLHLLAPKTTRTTQGVAVMNMKPKYRLETVKALEETSIANKSRYRVRAVPAAGALLRQEDSEEQQLGLLD